jgi:hypothetical protein
MPGMRDVRHEPARCPASRSPIEPAWITIQARPRLAQPHRFRDARGRDDQYALGRPCMRSVCQVGHTHPDLEHREGLMRRVLDRPLRGYADARVFWRLVRRTGLYAQLQQLLDRLVYEHTGRATVSSSEPGLPVRQALPRAMLTMHSVGPRGRHVSTGCTESTERQHATGTSAGDGHDLVISSNGHIWRTESRHPTSDGTVSYQRCHCGRWRVLLGPD